METIALIIIIVLLIIVIILIFVFRSKENSDLPQLLNKVNELQSGLIKIEANLKDDFRINREESTNTAKTNREELNKAITEFRIETAEAIRQLIKQNVDALEKLNITLEQRVTVLIDKTEKSFKTFSDANTTQLEKIEKQIETKLQSLNDQAKTDNNLIREALVKSFKDFQEAFDKNVKSFNDLQREKFGQLETKQNELVQSTEKKLESIRVTVEEKLEKTLSERLGQSFETVGKQLIEVQKGLGEMQTLAQDVGGLKKVLSNVKMRGGFGEVQLHMMLESILAPEQYEANVATKQGSSERVEYAVKFPNKEGERDFVWLPIDAKFPKDAYENLQLAYDSGDIQLIENAQKILEAVIKKMAKDICDKYLDSPNTTNFGIMFLPFEGLFAEVVRKASLLEQVQRECNVVITGPTTLAVILNSLQMGFRTLAIQKRSGEVWKILSAVKKEFSQFGGLLDKAQKNIQTGLNQLDDVVGTRTRAIQRQLKGVEMLEVVEEKIDTPDSLNGDLLEEGLTSE